MSSKYSVFITIIAILTALTSPARAEAPIKIALLTDLSNVATYYGNQTRLGALLAEQELKAAGENIEVIIDDSALNTTQALSATQKLLYVNHINAIYVDFSIIANAVSPLVQQNKKLMLYSAAAESIAHNNPYAFKSYSDYSLGCEAVTREFRKRGIKNIGVLKAEAEFGELCLSGARKADPDVISVGYQPAQSVSSQVLILKQKKVEAIVNGSFQIDILNMIQAAKTIKYPVKFGAPEDALVTIQVFEKFGDFVNGSLSFGLTQTNPEIETRVKQLPGADKVTAYESTLLAYVHFKQMYRALAACPDKNIDCVVDAFSKSKPEPLLGFEGWKDRLARNRTFIKEINNGTAMEVGSYIREP